MLKLTLAVIVVAVLAGGAAIYCRVYYGVFPWAGPPSRLDWCGRRFYPESPNGRLDTTGLRRVMRAPALVGASVYVRRGASCRRLPLELLRDAGGGRATSYVLSGSP